MGFPFQFPLVTWNISSLLFSALCGKYCRSWLRLTFLITTSLRSGLTQFDANNLLLFLTSLSYFPSWLYLSELEIISEFPKLVILFLVQYPLGTIGIPISSHWKITLLLMTSILMEWIRSLPNVKVYLSPGLHWNRWNLMSNSLFDVNCGSFMWWRRICLDVLKSPLWDSHFSLDFSMSFREMCGIITCLFTKQLESPLSSSSR